MTGHIARRLPAYAVLAAAGLVAGLALGRVEPVALAAPFLLAVVAAVGRYEPQLSVRLMLDRDRALEGDDVTATVELSCPSGLDRLDLLVLLPPELTARLTGFRGEIVWDTSKADGVLRKVLDVSKMESVLNWKPPTSLEAGLKRTIRWYLENKAEADARP